MAVDELLANSPKFHVDQSGELASWAISETVLRFLDENLDSSFQTLETGAGFSTVVFAANNTRHTSVVPSYDEAERIREYCAAHGISTEGVKFHIERSEDVLPRLDPTELDLVLIDGSHSFPSPFIDWYYTAFRLRVGGILVIDDTELWTGHTLKRFLEAEPGWTLCPEPVGMASAFVKESASPELRNWENQPFVARRSRPLQMTAKPRAVLRLIRAGRFGPLLHVLRRKIGRSKAARSRAASS
jgi:Methyltransferase domain